MRDLPALQIESRQGVDISRPQSRGFEGSIVQDTHVDGTNVIGTTAYPAEELDSVQVLTGLAGVFDYIFKRPTSSRWRARSSTPPRSSPGRPTSATAPASTPGSTTG